MYCIEKRVSTEDEIKKSRFIGIIYPCHSETQAIQALNQVYQQYPNASHIVFAYRILSPNGFITRFHDAGEPSGTAGKPVFLHLEGKNLINLICIVVRYFGGIKLGAGGLTRAYSNSAKKVIEASQLIEYIAYLEVNQHIEYKQLQWLEYQLVQLDGIITEQVFTDKIQLTIKIPEKNITALHLIFEKLNRENERI